MRRKARPEGRAFFVPALVLLLGLAGCESVTGVFGDRAGRAARIAEEAKALEQSARAGLRPSIAMTRRACRHMQLV